jgi:hypothetical protein
MEAAVVKPPRKCRRLNEVEVSVAVEAEAEAKAVDVKTTTASASASASAPTRTALDVLAVAASVMTVPTSRGAPPPRSSTLLMRILAKLRQQTRKSPTTTCTKTYVPMPMLMLSPRTPPKLFHAVVPALKTPTTPTTPTEIEINVVEGDIDAMTHDMRVRLGAIGKRDVGVGDDGDGDAEDMAAALCRLYVLTELVRHELLPELFEGVEDKTDLEIALRCALRKRPPGSFKSLLHTMRAAVWAFLIRWSGAPTYVTAACVSVTAAASAEPNEAVCVRWNAVAQGKLTAVHKRNMIVSEHLCAMVHPVCPSVAKLASHVAMLRTTITQVFNGSNTAALSQRFGDVLVFAATSVFIELAQLTTERARARSQPPPQPQLQPPPVSEPATTIEITNSSVDGLGPEPGPGPGPVHRPVPVPVPVPDPLPLPVSELPPARGVDNGTAISALCPPDLPQHYVALMEAAVAAFAACASAARCWSLRSALSQPDVVEAIQTALAQLADAAGRFATAEESVPDAAALVTTATPYTRPASAAARYAAFARLRFIVNSLACADLMDASFWRRDFAPLVRSVEASLRNDASFSVHMCVYIRNFM